MNAADDTLTKIGIETEEELHRTTEELLALPMVEWEQAAGKYDDGTLAGMSDILDSRIQRMARLRAYVDYRGGLGCGDHGHLDAVKGQNRLVAKIRRVMGFTYPRDDRSF